MTRREDVYRLVDIVSTAYDDYPFTAGISSENFSQYVIDQGIDKILMRLNYMNNAQRMTQVVNFMFHEVKNKIATKIAKERTNAHHTEGVRWY